MTVPTHDELVERAARWLRNSAVYVDYEGKPCKVRCGVVLTEASGANETPDAIGWYHGWQSILIECKASRADFFADQKKPWRRIKHNHKIGRQRYYMARQGLIGVEELPEDFGLLEVVGRKVLITKSAPVFGERALFYEMKILWSELRKIQLAQSGQLDKLTAKTRAGKRILSLVGNGESE